MKLDFNKPFLGLDGNPLPDGKTLGSIFAPIIAQQTKGDALKLTGWAMAIYKNEPIELDKSDQNTLKELINANDQMTVLMKSQLLECFEIK